MQSNRVMTLTFENLEEVRNLQSLLAKLSPEEQSLKSLILGKFRKKKATMFTIGERHIIRALKIKLKHFTN